MSIDIESFFIINVSVTFQQSVLNIHTKAEQLDSESILLSLLVTRFHSIHAEQGF